jgi:NAD/NADP transhydrogenase beta subunit
MPNRPQPEILPPLRATFRAHAQRLFSDENLDFLAHLLDDIFRIPGTPIRIGLDGLIGLIPGLGDVLAGIASFTLVFAAWVRGVPYVTLARMMVNLGLDVLIGAIPFFGDLFDIAYKANRRNYRLLTRHLRQPHRHTWKDYAFLASLIAAVLALLAAPLLVLVLIILWLAHRL